MLTIKCVRMWLQGMHVHTQDVKKDLQLRHVKNKMAKLI